MYVSGLVIFSARLYNPKVIKTIKVATLDQSVPRTSPPAHSGNNSNAGHNSLAENNALVTSIVGGLIIGVLVVFYRVSLAALLFSGDLSNFLAAGIGIMLLSTLISGLIATWLSGFSIVINGPQDTPAVMLGVMAAATIGGSAISPVGAFSTMVMLMALSTLLTGVILWCFGHYNLGSFVRYIPYPVMGGFMAGTGWLLVVGGIKVVADDGIGMHMFALDSILIWLPSVVFALVLLTATSQFTSPFVLPIVILSSLLFFYLSVVISGGGFVAGLEHALSSGWLIGPLPDGELWRPVTATALQHADWSIVFENATGLVVVALITTISLLLNCSGLELITRSDVNLNRELKTVGYSNIAGAAAGSSPGYHVLSLSTLTHQLGATHRITGVVVALIVVATLVFGTVVLNYAPKFLAAGFLIYLGLGFLQEWLYHGWFDLPRMDYILVWLIVIVIASIGLLQGVVVGILVAIVLFLVAYTNTDVVRHAFTRDKFQSTTMRSPPMERMLEQAGDRFYVMELQGFVFFGMAHKLLDKVKARLDDSEQTPLEYLLLDFRLVTGLDSSASYAFSRLEQIANQHGIKLAIANLNPSVRKSFESFDSAQKKTLIFKDTEQAITWFDESEIDRQAKHGSHFEAVNLVQYFESALPDKGSSEKLPEQSSVQGSTIERLQQFMKLRSVVAGTVLLEEGTPVNTVYFIESGEASAQTILPDGSVKTVRVQGAGTVVGEIGLYTGAPATATVVVSKDAELFGLSATELHRMESDDPHLAVAAHRLIATTLGRKLTQSNNALLALQK